MPFAAEAEEEVLKEELQQEREVFAAIKRKYQPAGVFLYMCGKCKNQAMLMHLPTCVSCGQANLYYEADPRISEAASSQIVAEIVRFYGLEGALSPGIATDGNVAARIDGQVGVRLDGQVNALMDGRVDGRVSPKVDGRVGNEPIGRPDQEMADESE